MSYYPVFLDISDASCLIVGAGEVGRRKLAGLMRAQPAAIVLLDPALPPAGALADDDPLRPLLADSRVRCLRQPFTESCVVGQRLVFAATSQRDINAAVAAACHKHGIWCNCADAPLAGNFIVPATACRGPLVAALSTGGASPALARSLRKELEDWLGPRAALAELMGRLRPLVLALGLNTAENTRIFRGLTNADIQNALAKQDRVRCEACLQAHLPELLHPHIVELLYDLV